MPDIESILTPLAIPKSIKADAWDAFTQSKDDSELTTRLQSLNIPKEAKAKLWDLKHQSSTATPTAQPQTDMRSGTDIAIDQATAAAKGLISPITSIPDQISQQGIWKTLASNLTPVGIAKGLWGGVKAVGEDVVPNIVHNVEALRQAYGGPEPTFGAAPTQAANERAAGTAGATAGGLLLGEAAMKAPSLFKAVSDRFPSEVRAGKNFETVKTVTKDIPIDLREANAAVDRALELRQRGASLPKVINDFAKNRKVAANTPAALTSGIPDPMTYEVGRDFASNAGRLSADEATKMAPMMKAQIAKFAKAMKEANRGAADSVGMGDLYDQAMKEYRQAKTIEEATDTIKKWGVRAALTAGTGYLGYSLYRDLQP